MYNFFWVPSHSREMKWQTNEQEKIQAKPIYRIYSGMSLGTVRVHYEEWNGTTKFDSRV